MHRSSLVIVGLMLSAVLQAACSDTPIWYENGGDCRYYNYDSCAYGTLGGYCQHNGECSTGYCCQSGHCGGGMCTTSCKIDADCPQGMGCEHDTCFWLCNGNNECAPDQKCEHGNHVCEY